MTAAASFRPDTFAAIEAVKRALTITHQGRAGDVVVKGGRDLVTAADLSVEDTIRSVIAKGSSIPVIGEERGGEAAAGSPYWLVDPICGTRNFASGIPLYAVNVALVEAGMVTVAVVGDPSTNGIDVAEVGQGAWRVSDRARRRLTTSDESRTIVVEDGKSQGARREQAARFVAAAIRADRWDFRSLGTTLASPYLAAGRIAAYVLFSASAIHAAAGRLLVAEAGGTVSDIDGRPWTEASDSFVASANRRLHEELLLLMRASEGPSMEGPRRSAPAQSR